MTVVALARASDVGMLSLDRFPLPEAAKPAFAQRFGTDHKGTDIFAPRGTPVLAVRDGKVRHSIENKGGKVVYLTANDQSRYYYAHLEAWHAAVLEADEVTVKSGDTIGYVGDSGNAKGKDPHLHFEMMPVKGAGQVDPFPYLASVAPANTPTRTAEAAMFAGMGDWKLWALLYFAFRKKGRR